jgi:hypothetical protein
VDLAVVARSEAPGRVFRSGMRLRLTILVAFAALAAPALASKRHEHVSIKPRVGDVNTKFVYSGSGWRPDVRLAFSHGALCGDGPCPGILQVGLFRSDTHGRFRVTEHPAHGVPDDFVGYSICFSYAQRGLPDGCRTTRRITVVPPWASVTPARVERYSNEPPSDPPKIATQHFKAGERLRIDIRYPDGRKRILTGRARRHGGYVRPAAYVPRGGLIRRFHLKSSDPDGTYQVRIADAHGGEARTSFVVKTSSG